MEEFRLENFGDIDKTKDLKKEDLKPKIVKASLSFYEDVLEFYKDFVYSQKFTSGNFGYGHKEATEEIIELLKEKYPNVKPRPQSERDRESNLGRKKKS
ncbi:MAG: hypothetical protein COA88_12930 [Kordia sp.]|nr:MAG: hypothetical protein COA88_12930 [Kordia sp.]